MTPRPTLPTSWNADDHGASWPFTRLLFDAARLAYRPRAEGLEGFRRLGLEAEFIQVRPTQAYAADVGRDVLVAFRGTEDVGDILTDLKLIRRHTPDGAVHSGFWDGYDRIHAAVASVARTAAGRDGRIWLTGHSLGGALAVVAAYRLAGDDRLPIGGVVTFGQPMVVLPSLAQALHPVLHDRYLCFVNGRDLFPKLVWPYVHFGELVLYRQGVFRRESIHPGDPPSIRSEAFGSAVPSPLLGSLDNEALDALIAELEAERATTGDRAGTRMKGMIPWTADHALAAYAALVDAFVGRITA